MLYDVGIYYEAEYGPFLMADTSSSDLEPAEDDNGKSFSGEVGILLRYKMIEGKIGYRYEKYSGVTGEDKKFSGIIA